MPNERTILREYDCATTKEVGHPWSSNYDFDLRTACESANGGSDGLFLLLQSSRNSAWADATESAY